MTFGDGDAELAGRIGRTDLQRLVDPETFERLVPEAQVFDLLRGVPAMTFNRLDVAMKVSFMETMANPAALYDARVYDEHIKVFFTRELCRRQRQSQSRHRAIPTGLRIYL